MRRYWYRNDSCLFRFCKNNVFRVKQKKRPFFLSYYDQTVADRHRFKEFKLLTKVYNWKYNELNLYLQINYGF